FMFKDENRIKITQKLIWYLNNLEYWHEPDNGIWEFGMEHKASSIGACIAGLKAATELTELQIPEGMIEKGEKALDSILPRESEQHFVDLAQLTLIYPYNILSEQMRDTI